MPEPLTPRQWAEKAFDGIEADESLFASVERVIGEAMAQAAADRIEQLEAEVARLSSLHAAANEWAAARKELCDHFTFSKAGAMIDKWTALGRAEDALREATATLANP